MRFDLGAWARTGFDAVGLLLAAFFAVVVEGFFTGPSWPFAVAISSGIAAGVIAILLLTRRFWKSKRVSLGRVVYRGASWTAGILVGIEVKLVLAMSLPAGVISTIILLAVVTWVVSQQQVAKKKLSQSVTAAIVVESATPPAIPASENWFRREDVVQFQKPGWPSRLCSADWSGLQPRV